MCTSPLVGMDVWVVSSLELIMVTLLGGNMLRLSPGVRMRFRGAGKGWPGGRAAGAQGTRWGLALQCQTLFHIAGTKKHSSHRRIKVPVVPHPFQH